MHTKFIKYINSALIIVLLCLFTSVFITSCKDDEEDGRIVLLSYGPMPIARGAELRFIGKNLDKVTSVVLPGDIEIAQLDNRTSEYFTITVPQNAVPGFLVLKTPQGDITPLTPMGFSEPMAATTMTPDTVKRGQVLTLTGDYLNLVGQVIFTDNIIVDSSSFITQSRYELSLEVPAMAKTGKIAVSNGAENPIIVYSEDTLQIVLPEITSISPNPVKAGTQLTITGTDLDLVVKARFGGERDVDSSDFLSQSGTQIVIGSIPINTLDNNPVKIIPASLVEVLSDSIVLIKPVITSVSPNPASPGVGTITVVGTDLDLISSVTFGGGAQGTIQPGGSATTITVKIDKAATNGIVTFGTPSETSVNSPTSLSMIVPTITGLTPVDAGGAFTGTLVTIDGTNLDIIDKALFEGNIESKIQNGGTQTSIQVMVPPGVEEGMKTVTLIATNGTELTSSMKVNVKHRNPTITVLPAVAVVGEKFIIEGTDLDVIIESYFNNEKLVTKYGEKTSTRLEVYVPSGISKGPMKFINIDGDVSYSDTVSLPSVRPIYDQNLCFFNFNGTGKDSWWGNAMGSGILNSPATSADGTPYWNINGTSGTSWWDGLFFRNGTDNFVTTGVNASTWCVRFDINIRQTIFQGDLRIRLGNYYYHFQPWDGVAAGYKTEGWKTMTAPLNEFLDGTTPLTDPSVGTAEFGMIWCSGEAVTVDMGIDNVRFEPIE